MKNDRNTPNQTSNKSKAEGERWSSEDDTVERQDRSRSSDDRMTEGDEGGGITNRPLDEEMENQDRLPERGDSREGAHAGHGDRKDQNK
jgi:hypothetical protein